MVTDNQYSKQKYQRLLVILQKVNINSYIYATYAYSIYELPVRGNPGAGSKPYLTQWSKEKAIE